MTVKELYDILEAIMDGNPKSLNEEVFIGVKSMRGNNHRCLMTFSDIDSCGEAPVLLAEDRA